MAVFAYQSIDQGGKRISGRLEATNLTDLEQRLRKLGLDLIDATLASGARASFSLLPSQAIGTADLITFCVMMQQMTQAGVRVIETLTDLRDAMDHPRFREVLGSLIESIEGGKSLSDALAEHPSVFDEVFVSLVRAGEKTGNLPEIMGQLADSLKWRDELAAQIKTLVAYPAFVGVVVLSVSCVLVVYLVPKLASLITNLGQALPLQTRALLVLSKLIENYWYLIAPLPFVIAGLFWWTLRTSPAAAHWFDGIKLRFPLVGPLLERIILSRFARIFGLMYASGITVLEAIDITRHVAGNRVISNAITEAGQLISQGQNITDAFRQVQLFPPLVLRMLAVGETTGALDESLANVSYFYDREVRERIARLQALIEPTMTVVLGAILLAILVPLFGPLYDMIAKIKA